MEWLHIIWTFIALHFFKIDNVSRLKSNLVLFVLYFLQVNSKYFASRSTLLKFYFFYSGYLCKILHVIALLVLCFTFIRPFPLLMYPNRCYAASCIYSTQPPLLVCIIFSAATALVWNFKRSYCFWCEFDMYTARPRGFELAFLRTTTTHDLTALEFRYSLWFKRFRVFALLMYWIVWDFLRAFQSLFDYVFCMPMHRI